MIDTTKEELLSMSQAAKVCPKVDGKRPHSGSIWRWASKGVKGVRLDHVRIGNRVSTSGEALDRFFDALTQAPPASPATRPPKGRTQTQREKAIVAAHKCLEKHGLNCIEVKH